MNDEQALRLTAAIQNCLPQAQHRQPRIPAERYMKYEFDCRDNHGSPMVVFRFAMVVSSLRISRSIFLD